MNRAPTEGVSVLECQEKHGIRWAAYTISLQGEDSLLTVDVADIDLFEIYIPNLKAFHF